MTSRRIIAALRILFGLHFLFNGLNYMFHFVDIPKPPGGDTAMANVLMDAFVNSGLFVIAKSVEVISGVMLIFNLWVPLYAALGAITLIWNGGLMLAYLPYYRPFLVRSATPGGDAR